MSDLYGQASTNLATLTSVKRKVVMINAMLREQIRRVHVLVLVDQPELPIDWQGIKEGLVQVVQEVSNIEAQLPTASDRQKRVLPPRGTLLKDIPELPTRIATALGKNGIHTVGDLSVHKSKDLSRMANIGHRSANIIKQVFDVGA